MILKKLLNIFYDFLATNDLVIPNFSNTTKNWQEHGITFEIFDVSIKDTSQIGSIGKIEESILSEYDLTEYFALEIEIDKLKKLQKIKYEKPSQQMPIFKDISFKLPAGFEVGKLTNLLQSNQYIFSIFDIYPSENLQTERNLGIRFTFSENHLTSNDEINLKIEKIKKLANKELNIES